MPPADSRAVDAHADLLTSRGEFPVLARSTYLVSHSLGAMHRDSAVRLARFAEEWAGEGVVAWRRWVPEMRAVADLVAEILGAPPGTVVLRQGVADLLGAVASCVDFAGPRNRVVYSDLEWPSSHYLWQEQRRLGADVVVVPSDGDGVRLDAQRLVDAIDDRTALVPISHVLFRSATLVDVQPVVERAHDVGALVVLDAYQSAGVLPVDVTALGVDLCVGGSVKYLCGGPGAAWLYAAPHVAERLRPAQVGWFGHARPFDFSFDAVEYAPGAQRFAGGTPPVPSVYAAAAGYRAVLDAGVRRIRERSLSLTQPMVEDALARGFIVRSPVEPERPGGHVTIDPHGDGQRVHDELHRRGFVTDFRPGAGIRIGPHFYNTADECAAVLAEIDAIVRGG